LVTFQRRVTGTDSARLNWEKRGIAKWRWPSAVLERRFGKASPSLSFPQRYIRSNSSLRALRAAISRYCGPTRITIATVRCLTLPSQRSRDLNGAPRVASTLQLPKNNAPSTVLSFASPFQPLHSQVPRTQASQRPAARRSSASQERPYGVLVPPTSQALQESRPWHLGAASRSRPPGGVP